MNIIRKQEADVLTLRIEGRLDTITAPQLENEIKTGLSSVNSLVLDLEKLDYISSAGLRVLLQAEKIMSRLGGMRILNVNEAVMEVFEITGFSSILTIE